MTASNLDKAQCQCGRVADHRGKVRDRWYNYCCRCFNHAHYPQESIRGRKCRGSNRKFALCMESIGYKSWYFRESRCLRIRGHRGPHSVVREHAKAKVAA